MQYILDQEGYDAIVDAYDKNVSAKTFKYVLNIALQENTVKTKKFGWDFDKSEFIVALAIEPENIKAVQLKRACKALCVKDPGNPTSAYLTFGKKKDEMMKVMVDYLNQHDDIITVARSNWNIGYEHTIPVLEAEIARLDRESAWAVGHERVSALPCDSDSD
tara:strand:+ start:2750 stop:3235 length:486 start_codon:yes stop_codon:yes gene_type:complete